MLKNPFAILKNSVHSLVLICLLFCKVFSIDYSFGIKTGHGASNVYGKSSNLNLIIVPSDTIIPIKTVPVKNDMWGFYGRIIMSEMINVQIEGLYETRGFQYNEIDNSDSVILGGQVNFEYLEVPILILFKKKIGKIFAPYILLGQSYSLSISQKSHLTSHIKDQIYFLDGIGQYKLFDIGLPLVHCPC